jgi:hypothetical protein
VYEKGTYTLSVTSSGEAISGSSFIVTVDDGAISALSTVASGQGLVSGTAGETFSFEVQTRDIRQKEVQVIAIDAKYLPSGNFKLTYGGESTANIDVFATANTVENELLTLTNIQAVSVTEDVVGLYYDSSSNLQNAGTLSMLKYFTVTFDDDTGDLGSIDFTDDSLGYPNNPTTSTAHADLPATPVLNVYEIRKGSTGNDREDDADLANLEFTLTHDTATGADSSALMIGMYETQTISCSSTTWNAAAVATISFGDKSTTTTVDISLADLQTKLETDLGTGTVSVTADSSETQLCENGASNIIKIAFTGTKFTVPTFEISIDDSAFTITPGILVDGVDSVTYISDGLYTIEYTPTIKGHYAADVSVSGTSILTDLSAGVTVYPAAASGPQTTHSSSWFEMEDVTATFAIQATDRFGNELDGSLTAGTDFSVQLVGSPDPCSGVSSGIRSLHLSLSLLPTLMARTLFLIYLVSPDLIWPIFNCARLEVFLRLTTRTWISPTLSLATMTI